MEQDKLELEAFMEKLLAEDIVESPSSGFTDRVMSSIKLIETSSATIYQPLISQKAWGLIGLFSALLMLLVYFKKDETTSHWMSKVTSLQIDLNPLSSIDFNVSGTMSYALGLLALMLLIQVSVLKIYFNNRFDH